jgi:hypothetical protein
MDCPRRVVLGEKMAWEDCPGRNGLREVAWEKCSGLVGRLGPQGDGLGLVRMLGLPLLAQAVGIHKPEAPNDPESLYYRPQF